jgi:hypothetical protein
MVYNVQICSYANMQISREAEKTGRWKVVTWMSIVSAVTLCGDRPPVTNPDRIKLMINQNRQ